jgi:hypothetical protein
MRSAEERLRCCRRESIAATRSDNVIPWCPAISFNLFQNASSRLTLVSRPASATDLLTTRDFIDSPQNTRVVKRSNTHLVPSEFPNKKIFDVAKTTRRSVNIHTRRTGQNTDGLGIGSRGSSRWCLACPRMRSGLQPHSGAPNAPSQRESDRTLNWDFDPRLSAPEGTMPVLRRPPRRRRGSPRLCRSRP